MSNGRVKSWWGTASSRGGGAAGHVDECEFSWRRRLERNWYRDDAQIGLGDVGFNIDKSQIERCLESGWGSILSGKEGQRLCRRFGRFQPLLASTYIISGA
jgi:hypothetical protein